MRGKVFISYCHKENAFLNQFLEHLKPYTRSGSITHWSDKQIQPGSQWFDDIKKAIQESSVAVMLVTPGFLASDFIHEHELGPLLKEAEAGGVTILWVLVRDCSYGENAFESVSGVGITSRQSLSTDEG